jgi:hypothetical protein
MTVLCGSAGLQTGARAVIDVDGGNNLSGFAIDGDGEVLGLQRVNGFR